MKYFIAVMALVGASVMGTGVAQAGEPDPPNKTGCCFSFDDSPINLVFCMTENACTFTPPRS